MVFAYPGHLSPGVFKRKYTPNEAQNEVWEPLKTHSFLLWFSDHFFIGFGSQNIANNSEEALPFQSSVCRFARARSSQMDFDT